MPEYHMGVPSWGGGSRSWSVAETVPLEGTSWKHQAVEGGGERRILNDYLVASAPQLKRGPLASNHEHGPIHLESAGRRSPHDPHHGSYLLDSCLGWLRFVRTPHPNRQ